MRLCVYGGRELIDLTVTKKCDKVWFCQTCSSCTAHHKHCEDSTSSSFLCPATREHRGPSRPSYLLIIISLTSVSILLWAVNHRTLLCPFKRSGGLLLARCCEISQSARASGGIPQCRAGHQITRLQNRGAAGTQAANGAGMGKGELKNVRNVKCRRPRGVLLPSSASYPLPVGQQNPAAFNAAKSSAGCSSFDYPQRRIFLYRSSVPVKYPYALF